MLLLQNRVLVLPLAELIDVIIVSWWLKISFVQCLVDFNPQLFYLVRTQDGSYSRGPVTIPVGEVSESNYYLTPTFKFEQVCLLLFFYISEVRSFFAF